MKVNSFVKNYNLDVRVDAFKGVNMWDCGYFFGGRHSMRLKVNLNENKDITFISIWQNRTKLIINVSDLETNEDFNNNKKWLWNLCRLYFRIYYHKYNYILGYANEKDIRTFIFKDIKGYENNDYPETNDVVIYDYNNDTIEIDSNIGYYI